MGGTSQARKEKKEKSKMKRKENRIILAHILTSLDMPSELPYLTLKNEIMPETAGTMTYKIKKEIFSHLHIL